MLEMRFIVPIIFLLVGGFLLLVGYLVKPADAFGNILFFLKLALTVSPRGLTSI